MVASQDLLAGAHWKEVLIKWKRSEHMHVHTHTRTYLCTYRDAHVRMRLFRDCRDYVGLPFSITALHLPVLFLMEKNGILLWHKEVAEEAGY